jgi:hypothetical protein
MSTKCLTHLIVVQLEVSPAQRVLHPPRAVVSPGQQLQVADALRALILAQQVVRMTKHAQNTKYHTLPHIPTHLMLSLLVWQGRGCLVFLRLRSRSLMLMLMLVPRATLHRLILLARTSVTPCVCAPPRSSPSSPGGHRTLGARRHAGIRGRRLRPRAGVAPPPRDLCAELRAPGATGHRDAGSFS